MRAARVSAELLWQLVVMASELVLLPVRLMALLFGSLLLMAGMLGLPIWLIQLAISVVGGGGGGGPLPAWKMCLLLAAAVPIGVMLTRLADVSVELAGPQDLPVDPAEPEESEALGVSGASDSRSGAAAPELSRRSEVLKVASTTAANARVVRHEPRVRIGSRQVRRLQYPRRGEH